MGTLGLRILVLVFNLCLTFVVSNIYGTLFADWDSNLLGVSNSTNVTSGTSINTLNLKDLEEQYHISWTEFLAVSVLVTLVQYLLKSTLVTVLREVMNFAV